MPNPKLDPKKVSAFQQGLGLSPGVQRKMADDDQTNQQAATSVVNFLNKRKKSKYKQAGKTMSREEWEKFQKGFKESL